MTPSQASVAAGQSVQLTATLVSANGDELPTSGVTWTSSDTRVATVSSSGLVSGVSFGGPVTITAMVGSVTGRADVTVTGGAATQLAIVTQPDDVASSGTALGTQPVVRLLDQDGNETVQAGVVVTAVLAQGLGALASATATTDALGVATFSGLAISGTAGAYRIRFESGALASATSDEIALGAGAPAEASIAVPPPSTVQSGVVFSTQPQVSVRDDADNPVPGAIVTVTVSSGQGAVGGTSTAVTDGSGTATFTALSVTGATGDLTLRFTAGSASVETGTVSLEPGLAATLEMVTQPPASAQNGVVLSPQPAVSVRDGSGNAVPGVDVTASIETGGGSLNGTVTVATDPTGVATFADLFIVGTAGLRTLRFQSGGASVVSTAIDLEQGVPAQVVVTQQPSSTAQSTVQLGQQPVVSVTDAGGNPVPFQNVTATIASGGGTLGGTASVMTDAGGVATFADLTISGTIGARTLQFTAGSAQATSSSIDLQAGPLTSLTIIQQPSSTVANAVAFPQQPRVTATDAFANPVPGVTVTAAIQSGGGTLNGTLGVNTDASGVATFSGLRITGVVGVRTLRFAGGSEQVVSNAIDVRAGTPASVSIVTQPPAIALDDQGFSQSPRVEVQDVSGNVVPSTNVVASIASGGGSLIGTTNVATNGSGRATFSNLSIDGFPGERTLRFTAGGAQSTSSPVHVALKAGTYTELQYCGSNPLQRLDVYVPSNAFPRPRPVVAYVHGGGWIGRDKGDTDLVLWTNERDELLSRGYVVTTLNYRLAVAGQPSTQWPAALHDLKCAVRHLRADGLDYGGDGTRIGVWGGSAGGHLVSMLGTTAGTLEGSLGYAGVSSAVQAVVTIGGITDMRTAPAIAELLFSGGEIMFEATWPGPSSQMTEASPANWASSDDPPFIIIHGQEDTTVDPNQGERFNTALGNAGASVQIERVVNGGHNLEDVGGSANPSIATLVQTVADFFDGLIP